MDSESDGAEELWLAAGPLAAVGTLGCAAIVAGSFGGGPGRLPDVITLPAQATAVPIAVLSVISLVVLTRRRRLLTVMASSAPSILPVTGLLLVGFWGFAVFGMCDRPHELVQRDGRYYAVYKFEVDQISREEYERFESLERRQSAAFCGALYVPGVGLGIHAWYRRRTRRAELARLGAPDTAEAAATPPRRRRRPQRDKARRHRRRKRDRNRRSGTGHRP